MVVQLLFRCLMCSLPTGASLSLMKSSRILLHSMWCKVILMVVALIVSSNNKTVHIMRLLKFSRGRAVFRLWLMLRLTGPLLISDTLRRAMTAQIFLVSIAVCLIR